MTGRPVLPRRTPGAALPEGLKTRYAGRAKIPDPQAPTRETLDQILTALRAWKPSRV